MSGRKKDEPLFCNVRSLAFCLVTESRNSMLKWKEKNLQATRTEPEFCFHSSCSYTSTLVAGVQQTTSSTRSWAVHRKWWYVTDIITLLLRIRAMVHKILAT